MPSTTDNAARQREIFRDNPSSLDLSTNMMDCIRLDARFLDHPYRLGGRLIDPIAGTVKWDGEVRPLRRKPLEVLAWLASAKSEVVQRSTFIDHIWEGNSLVGEPALTDTISSLRRALQDADTQQPLVRTIPRRGYQLNGEALLITAAAEAAVFAPGSPVPDKPEWSLSRLLGSTDANEIWLAHKAGQSVGRVFRFCRNEQHLRLLRREVTLLRYLRQALAGRPDTAIISDWQLDDPPYYVEMDLAAHGSLAEWLASQGGPASFALGERVRWMAAAAAALAAVHSVDIVHRNLSPASILIDESEGRLQIKLGEFGLGELTDRSRLQALKITAAGMTSSGGEPSGSQIYLAPEIRAGKIATAASDIYALGVLLHQMVVANLSRALRPDWEDEVDSATLRQLISACTAERPEARPTAQAVAEQLQQFDPDAQTNKSTDKVTRKISSADLPAAVPYDVPEARSTQGKLIGPYRILEALGDGGMGSVYLAEQRSPVRRTVALKVIKTGMDSGQVLARFEAERQALALMNHVNVAAVYDADETESGQPYFAMEYVPGLDITAHCDKQELDFRQRSELFLQVCDGVMHAHQKGLIHRDLKPGNILVKKLQDQASTVKIIDFGVAKSLHGKLGAHTAHTRIGSYVGTPVYSSPEQILGHQTDVDTRADIYSLGVVLYELLAGVTPYSDEELSDKSHSELVKLLSRSDPPDLATRFRSLDPEEETEIAQHRSTTVARLIELLGADLSWIVAKCLERDPDDRYASVLELKKDLQRWLENRPVEARPITRSYRLRKLLRRHRAAVAITAAVALTLLATTTAAVIGYQRAEIALRQAELAAEFQVDQMKSIDPEAIGLGVRRGLIKAVETRLSQRSDKPAEPGLAQLEELLDGVEFTSLITAQLDQAFFKPSLDVIAKKYAEFPGLQASLWQSSADTLYELGLYGRALEPQDLAISRRTELFGESAQLTLESKARKGRILAELDRTPEAVAILDQTIKDMREHTGLDSPAALDALSARAAILAMEGLFQPARDAYEEVADRSRKLFGENDRRTLYANVEYAKTLDSDRAAPLFKQAIEKLSVAVGQDHPDTLAAMAELAWARYNQNRMDEAIDLARVVLQRRTRVLGEGHPSVIAAEMSLASLLGQARQIREARPLFRSAIAGFEELQGKHAAKTAIARGNFGFGLWRAGDLLEAESQSRFAAETLGEIYGVDTPGESTYASNLAAVLLAKGKYKESQKLFEARIALLTRINGNRELSAQAREGLGQIFLAQGDVERACTEFKAGVDTLADREEDARDMLLKVKSAWAICLHLRDGGDEGYDLLNTIIADQRGSTTTDALDLATSLIYRARMLNDRKAWEPAMESADEALQIMTAALPDGHFAMVAAATQKIRALRAVKKATEASESYQVARRIIDKTPGLDPAYERELTAAAQP